jgi:hypothetical protein
MNKPDNGFLVFKPFQHVVGTALICVVACNILSIPTKN